MLMNIICLSAMLAWGQTQPTTTTSDQWRFEPNQLRVSSPSITALVRPLGPMHGVIIEKMGDAASPVIKDRALLNLEHYLAKGRYADFLPRKLKQYALLKDAQVSVHFPPTEDWPLTSQLSYSFPEPNVIDAELTFEFDAPMEEFEVYFTSYMTAQFERRVRVNGQWIKPDISESEQLLIPRDDKIAGRFNDGRWAFLADRQKLADYRFDLPVMISQDADSGWTLVQMIEPGVCTHIAPNLFAAGHNFIIGGWSVKKGEQRTARIRLLVGRNLSNEDVEKAYKEFADQCRKAISQNLNRDRATAATNESTQ